MADLYLKTVGSGFKNIILIHGWGLTSDVWTIILPKMLSRFRVHLIDLPGYGRSKKISPMSLRSISNKIWEIAPKNSIWLGWSLGGLIASRIVIDHSQDVSGLITVASSPCFIADKNGWPGICEEVLFNFENQLINNFYKTIEQFLIFQTLGSKNRINDFRILKTAILKQPIPDVNVLNSGLKILRTEDIRDELKNLSVPFLRIYGYLDNLIPRKSILLLDKLYPNSLSVTMRDCAHAPFISNPDDFCKHIYDQFK